MMTLDSELIRAVQRLSCCHDLSEVMAVLRETARNLTGADGVTVVLRDGDLCHYADENAIAPLWKGHRFPMKTCISGWCMLHREQVTIPDIYVDSRIPHDAYRPTFVKSLAMTPIRSEDPIGAIGAYWADHHQASTEELEILQALGDSASVAIANVQLIDSLKEANQRKDEFLAMLAHELRNPLAPIRNALHILRLRPDDAVIIERTREIMERQVQHLAQIVDDLLDVSRLTQGKVTLHRERLDLTRLVRQSAEDRRNLLEMAGLTLNIQLPQIPVWVMGDATRLTQVLGNVLDNAGKFTPPGGMVNVSLTLGAQGNRAAVTVRDTGIGIESEMLPHIFETFAQSDRSLDRSRGGLGLGLSVAKGLLDMHEGTIEASSGGSGRGTEITFQLPCEAELPALTQATTGKPTGKHVRILIVEDNLDAAESLRTLLELSGYEVTVAFTGLAGVETAKTLRPDIVLCDIGLPEMDGFAVARALRHTPETAVARLIAVTGYAANEDRQQTLAAGFDVHLVKPVDPEVLLGHLA